VTMSSLPFLALAVLLTLSHQAVAFRASSTTTTAVDIPNASMDLEKIDRFELLDFEFDDMNDDDDNDDLDDEIDIDENDDFEEDQDEIEEYDEEEDENFDEDEHEDGEFDEDEHEDEVFDEDEHDEEIFDEEENEHEDEEEEHKDDWTPEDYEQMGLLYDRYISEVAVKYGANWEEEFEMVVDEEELYERYLEHKEKAEEKRRLTEAYHKALLQHDESIRVETINTDSNYYNYEPMNHTAEQFYTESAAGGDAMASDIPPRRQMVVINTGVSYYNYNKNNNDSSNDDNSSHDTSNFKCSGQECPATTTIITTRRGDTQIVIGSI